MPEGTWSILTIPGSLREGSYNRALARAVPRLLPRGARADLFELHDIPLYNADLDNDQDRPASVVALKSRIEAADALLFVTPEYNHGVPGVLKNALDWASRPAFRSPMAHKPCGLMGAARGATGAVRGQQALKLVLLGMASQVFPHAGVAVGRAGQKFDDALALDDADTRSFVSGYLEAYVAWARRVAV